MHSLFHHYVSLYLYRREIICVSLSLSNLTQHETLQIHPCSSKYNYIIYPHNKIRSSVFSSVGQNLGAVLALKPSHTNHQQILLLQDKHLQNPLSFPICTVLLWVQATPILLPPWSFQLFPLIAPLPGLEEGKSIFLFLCLKLCNEFPVIQT